MKLPSLSVLMAVCFIGCSGSLKMDRSADAFTAGDLTLVSSCVSTPGVNMSMASGVDSCRFTNGDTVSGKWILIAPVPKVSQKVTGGTVDVYFKDLHKSYPITDWTIPIDFATFLGIGKWSKDFDEGVLEALVTLNWVDNQGLQQVTRFRGIAVILVNDSGYERLPIDSGNEAWGTTCKIQYTPAGRSAILCK